MRLNLINSQYVPRLFHREEKVTIPHFLLAENAISTNPLAHPRNQLNDSSRSFAPLILELFNWEEVYRCHHRLNVHRLPRRSPCRKPPYL